MRTSFWEKGKRIYLLYTLLFGLLALGVFGQFFLHNKSMIIKPDGYLQHYTALVKLRHLIGEFLRTGHFAFWSWDSGMGADTIAYYANVLFDPFAWICTLFGERHMDIGYTLVFLLRLYASGITFAAFARYMKYENWKVLLGALSYAFSAWALGCMMQSFFVYTMVLFPVLILGIEKVYRRESPVPLVLSTFGLAIFSIFFLQTSGILAAIYCIVRYRHYHTRFRFREFLREMLRLLGWVLVALAMSMVIFLPKFYALWNASKDSTNNSALFYTMKQYLLLLPSFVTDTEVFGNYSSTSVGVLFTLLIPIFLKKKHRKKAPVLMWLICFVILAAPVLGRLFNGLKYPTGRWMYGMAFFCLWSGLEALGEAMSGRRKKLCIWIGLLAVVYLLFGSVLQLFDRWQKLALAVNGGFGVLLLLVLTSGKLRCRKVALVALAAANLLVIHHLRYVPGITDYLENAYTNGRFYSKISKSVQRVGSEIEDEEFYRIYQLTGISSNRVMHVPVNEQIYWGNRSIYVYHSLIDNRWHQWNKALVNSAGYSQRIFVYGNDLRTRLDFLAGVKYFLGDSGLTEDTLYDHERQSCGAVGYGFDTRELIDGVEVLKNKYSIGLGMLYDKVIPRSEFDTLSVTEKEECLMQAAVLSDEDIGKLSVSETISARDIKTESYEMPYRVEKPQNCALTEQGFAAENEEASFDIVLDEVEDSEIYLFFDGLERTAGGLRQRNFDAAFSTDQVTKKIVNYAGRNQAFSDVTDYCVNMGYYERFSGAIHARFMTKGTYRYDKLQVFILPRGDYDIQAQTLEQRRLNVETFGDNYVRGTVTSPDGGMLYLSIIKTPGWRIFIDGERAKRVYDTDIAYTGVEVEAGTHTVELKYRPVGFYPGFAVSILGFAVFLCSIALHIHKKKFIIRVSNENENKGEAL